MDIYFKSTSLATICNNSKKMLGKYGERNTRIIKQRLQEIEATENLAQLMKLPGPRCHPLKGNRKGQYAVDALNPYRITFEVADDPIPRKEDGGVDLERVSAIRILRVEDYHV